MPKKCDPKEVFLGNPVVYQIVQDKKLPKKIYKVTGATRKTHDPDTVYRLSPVSKGVKSEICIDTHPEKQVILTAKDLEARYSFIPACKAV